jgi:hypothetical protein
MRTAAVTFANERPNESAHRATGQPHHGLFFQSRCSFLYLLDAIPGTEVAWPNPLGHIRRCSPEIVCVPAARRMMRGKCCQLECQILRAWHTINPLCCNDFTGAIATLPRMAAVIHCPAVAPKSELVGTAPYWGGACPWSARRRSILPITASGGPHERRPRCNTVSRSQCRSSRSG